MRAGVDHIIVNVNDYAAAKKFYSWLMPQIGYPKAMSYDQAQTDVTTGYFGDHGSVWIRPSDPEFRADTFHRHRVGLCEIAFAAESREQIDELATKISGAGGQGHRPAERVRLPTGILRGVLHRSGRTEAGARARSALRGAVSFRSARARRLRAERVRNPLARKAAPVEA